MQVFHIKTVIRAKRADVWDVFTDPRTWESWYGGSLASVDPSWQSGATLKWKVGPPSTLLEVNPPEHVRIGSGGIRTTWRFTEQGGQTLVEMETDFREGTVVVANPAAHQQQCEDEINGLKRYVERTHPPGLEQRGVAPMPAATAPPSARPASRSPLPRDLSFTALFDPGRFGYNFLAGAAYLVAQISWGFTWALLSLVRGYGVHFLPAGYHVVNLGFGLIAAVVFVLIIHRVRPVWLLPLVQGAVSLLLWIGIRAALNVLHPEGIPFQPVFSPLPLALSFFHSFMLLLCLVCAVHFGKVRLGAILTGAVCGVLIPGLASEFAWAFRQTTNVFDWQQPVCSLINGLILGGLLYAAIIQHLQNRGLRFAPPGEEAMAARTASSFYFVCSGNPSLIATFGKVFEVAALAGWGRVGRYSLNLFDGRLSAAQDAAKGNNLRFGGEKYLGRTREPMDKMEDLLTAFQASANRDLHIAFANVGDAHAEWVHMVYNELLEEAVRQGILPFRMYVTKDREAGETVLNLLHPA